MTNQHTSTTHIAGPDITIDGIYLRQRCAWCGEVLLEYNLTRTAVPIGTDPKPATWPLGAQVTVDGNAQYVCEDEKLSPDACARNPLTLASFNN